MLYSRKSQVVISRQLRPFSIKVEIWPEDAEVSMDLEEFVTALAREIPNPQIFRSRARFVEELHRAANVTVEKMKQDSVPAFRG